MQPKVSIITVNFNGIRFLRDFFDSVKNLHYDNIELIFVDNASTDGSVDYVRQDWPGVKVIENKENLGFSIANNIAAKNASGEFLFFLNNNTKIHPNTVFELVNNMSAKPELGICGCKMMSYNGREFFHAGIGIDIFGFPVVNGETFYVEGAALMIRKQLFKALGGFDPTYFMFHEDIDLSWRIWLLGYQVAAIPEAVVYHYIGASAGGTTPKNGRQYKSTFFRRYFSERNNLRTLLKNYTIGYLVLILPIYCLINIMEMLLFLLILKPRVSLCYIRAYAWNLINLKDTLSYRSKIQRNRKISDKKIMLKMHKSLGKKVAFNRVGIPRFE